MVCINCGTEVLLHHALCPKCVLSQDKSHFEGTWSKVSCVQCKAMSRGSWYDFKNRAKVYFESGVWPSRDGARLKQTEPSDLPSRFGGERTPRMVPLSKKGQSKSSSGGKRSLTSQLGATPVALRGKASGQVDDQNKPAATITSNSTYVSPASMDPSSMSRSSDQLTGGDVDPSQVDGKDNPVSPTSPDTVKWSPPPGVDRRQVQVTDQTEKSIDPCNSVSQVRDMRDSESQLTKHDVLNTSGQNQSPKALHAAIIPRHGSKSPNKAIPGLSPSIGLAIPSMTEIEKSFKSQLDMAVTVKPRGDGTFILIPTEVEKLSEGFEKIDEVKLEDSEFSKGAGKEVPPVHSPSHIKGETDDTVIEIPESPMDTQATEVQTQTGKTLTSKAFSQPLIGLVPLEHGPPPMSRVAGQSRDKADSSHQVLTVAQYKARQCEKDKGKDGCGASSRPHVTSVSAGGCEDMDAQEMPLIPWDFENTVPISSSRFALFFGIDPRTSPSYGVVVYFHMPLPQWGVQWQWPEEQTGDSRSLDHPSGGVTTEHRPRVNQPSEAAGSQAQLNAQSFKRPLPPPPLSTAQSRETIRGKQSLPLLSDNTPMSQVNRRSSSSKGLKFSVSDGYSAHQATFVPLNQGDFSGIDLAAEDDEIRLQLSQVARDDFSRSVIQQAPSHVLTDLARKVVREVRTVNSSQQHPYLHTPVATDSQAGTKPLFGAPIQSPGSLTIFSRQSVSSRSSRQESANGEHSIPSKRSSATGGFPGADTSNAGSGGTFPLVCPTANKDGTFTFTAEQVASLSNVVHQQIVHNAVRSGDEDVVNTTIRGVRELLPETTPRSLDLPRHELPPPEGWEIPGIAPFLTADQRRVFQARKASEPCVDPIRKGKPLSELSSQMTSELRTGYADRMEVMANNIRERMSRDIVPPGVKPKAGKVPSYWKVTKETKDPSMEEDLEALGGKVVPPTEPSTKVRTGLPVTDRAKVLLQKVGYSQQAGRVSDLAFSVNLYKEHFKQCADYNLKFAQHEAEVLSAEQRKLKNMPIEDSDKAMTALLEERTGDKWFLESARQSARHLRDTVKCSLATVSAVEAARHLCDTSFKTIKDRLDTCREISNSPSVKQLIQELEPYIEDLSVLRDTLDYADVSSRATVDAGARAARQEVLRTRTRAGSTILRLGQDKPDSAVLQEIRKLPVTPSSLCSGRWFNAVQRTGQLSEQRDAVVQIVNKVEGGAKLKDTTSKSKRKQPFHEEGASGSSHESKKSRTSNTATSSGSGQNQGKPKAKGFNPKGGKPRQRGSRGKGGKKPDHKRGSQQ